MSKKLLFWAMLLAMPLLLTACGDDEETATTEDAYLKRPSMKAQAMSYVLDNANNSFRVKSISLTEAGNFIVKQFRASGGSAVDYTMGKYTYQDGVYTLPGFGKVFLLGKREESATILIQLENGDEQRFEVTITNVPVSGLNYALCREWKMDGALLISDVKALAEGIRLDGILETTKVQKQLNRYGVAATGLDGYTVTGMEFSEDGDVIIRYLSHDPHVGTWTWAETGQTINLGWEVDDAATRLFRSPVSVSVSKGTCFLTFKTEVTGNGETHPVTLECRLIDAH